MMTTLKNEDNLRNEDDLKSWLGVVEWVPKQCFQLLIPLKVANDTLALPIETIPVWVGSARSNSDYKAISASQQSWSLGLAELGKMLVKKNCGSKKNSKEFLVQKTFKSMKIIGQINFESKQILGPKKFCVKKFGFKNILGPKKF